MNNQSNQSDQRLALIVRGAVQGVGFRPFVYRLATELNLAGWVNNTAAGVFIEVEGNRDKLEIFLTRLSLEKPPRSLIENIETQWLNTVDYQNFSIRQSSGGEKNTIVLPDLATCPDCLADIFDPNNRRYRYPFTNCTNCGPRYSIIESLPYDRSATTMRGFNQCSQCQREYENPLDRRFHAQPNACPRCGPQISLLDSQGSVLAEKDQALIATARAIKQGKIIAIKGLGGFHLVVDARNTEAVQKLRQRKQRPDKPFAVMYPNLYLVKKHGYVSSLESQLLQSPAAAIVLIKQRKNYLSAAVSPGNPYLGVMLPSTPLHHLLLAELGFPIVATSGNLADEPICIEEKEALEKLGTIADLFLVHNRPIVRPVDDSIIREMAGKAMILRRARGYAPFPVKVNYGDFPPILAVGSYFKNTVAIYQKNQVFISQHIGDLDTVNAVNHFENILASLKKLYEFAPEIIACDAHPEYLATKYAYSLNLPVIPIQHHYAHILSCMAEHQLQPPVLGVAWDGTGYGLDGTIWGGEFIHITADSWQRVAHFKPWPLLGGEKAVKEPRRVALGLLEVMENTDRIKSAFSEQEWSIFRQMLTKKINCPLTSSVGRLFDGVAAILGLCYQLSFEGQAAMQLEFALEDIKTEEYYNFSLSADSPIVIDWNQIILGVVEDLEKQVQIGIIAAKFHNSLCEIILEIAHKIGREKILLTGGCFQNRYLTERTINRLQASGFQPYWQQTVPTNDGGISLGQIIGAFSQLKRF